VADIAAGQRSPGEPWRIGVGWPDAEGLATILALSDRAVATSSPLATAFGPEAHHLFDPRTGRPAQSWTSVSVIAPTAMRADALSTAIAVAPKPAAETILRAGGGLEAILIDDTRHVTRLRA
jgi:thiamine biosynthesis lipoprotein